VSTGTETVDGVDVVTGQDPVGYVRAWWRSAPTAQQLRALMHNRTAMTGLLIVVFVLLLALLAPVIAPDNPLAITPDILKGPSGSHLFGTDELGRDVFSRVLYGARITPLAGIIPVVFSAIIGSLLGLTAAFAVGVVDNTIMRLIDVLLAFPGIVLAIAVVAVLGPGLGNAEVAVGIAGIPIFARVVRGLALVERQKDYILAARMNGARTPRIVFFEVVPNVTAPVLILATLSVGGAILYIAGLSFLGLGAQLPRPEWGAMLSEGRSYLPNQWWIATFPGIAIALTVLGINLLGDGLRDVFDPRV
jgi:peptide/nickel transport system permease protein